MDFEEAPSAAAPPVAAPGIWDEERERALVEAWAHEQQQRTDADRENARKRLLRRRLGIAAAVAVGWATLNVPVRSLGGADDTLGHALGRAASTRSLFPLREFGWKISSRASWAAAWGGERVVSAGALPRAGMLSCDVAVVGATPAGVAAALAAARRGAQVIVVEKRAHAGGDVVYAMLNMFDVMARPGETARVHGIFQEFFEQLGVSCDIDRAQALFDGALRAEPNIRFITKVEVDSVYKDGDKLAGIHIRQGKAGRAIACKVLVDATNDAEIAAMSGVGYYIGRQEANPDKKMQSAGLLFSVKGVNWNKVRAYVAGKRVIEADERKNRRYAIDIAPFLSHAQKKLLALGAKSMREKAPGDKAFGEKHSAKSLLPTSGLLAQASKVWLRAGGGMGNYAWERGDIVRGYKPAGRDVIMLSINFGRQSDGSVVLNTLNLVNVDGLNPASRKKARDEGVRELPFLLKYLRVKMPGFEKATLGRIAPELYIRETRHIHGYYALKVSDIRRREKFFDRIAHAAYPLDLHPYTKTDRNPFGPQRFFYTLPLRSIVPRGVDNVFVASRSLSATYSAAGSARVIPVTMAAGEAAGVAAWQCAINRRTPHELLSDYALTRVVQDSLRKGGADLGD